MWNKALCGVPQIHVSLCPSVHHQPREKAVLVVKYVLPIIASIVLITLILVLILTRRQRRKIRIPNEDNSVHVIAPKRFSHQELLQATNGFAEYNLIGTESFSSVYKGHFLKSCCCNKSFWGSLKSFDTEFKVMHILCHRILIKVIGSCSNLDFKAFVFDYMRNGSLEKWLHNFSDYCVDILQRTNIMIDVSLALEHLHQVII